MPKVFLPAVCGLILIAGSLPAFDAPGIIKKVDPDKRLLFVHAGGQDRTVKIAQDCKVLGADDKPLADGLKAKELKEGAEVTITMQRSEGGPIIKVIRLGRRGGPPQGNPGGRKSASPPSVSSRSPR